MPYVDTRDLVLYSFVKDSDAVKLVCEYVQSAEDFYNYTTFWKNNKWETNTGGFPLHGARPYTLALRKDRWRIYTRELFYKCPVGTLELQAYLYMLKKPGWGQGDYNYVNFKVIGKIYQSRGFVIQDTDVTWDWQKSTAKRPIWKMIDP